MNPLIESYLKERGFGSMTKNDFEVAIFNEILNENAYSNYSDFDFSRELRIPETKVKRLRYEAGLRYGKPNYRLKFWEIILKIKLSENTEIVQMLIPDKSVREYVNDVMRKNNIITDGGFNSDILKISLNDLCELIDNMYTEVEKKQLLEILSNVDNAAENLQKNNAYALKDYVRDLLTGVASSVIGSLVMTMFK